MFQSVFESDVALIGIKLRLDGPKTDKIASVLN